MNEFLYTETHQIINVSKQRVRTNLVKGRCICHENDEGNEFVGVITVNSYPR